MKGFLVVFCAVHDYFGNGQRGSELDIDLTILAPIGLQVSGPVVRQVVESSTPLALVTRGAKEKCR